MKNENKIVGRCFSRRCKNSTGQNQRDMDSIKQCIARLEHHTGLEQLWKRQ